MVGGVVVVVIKKTSVWALFRPKLETGRCDSQPRALRQRIRLTARAHERQIDTRCVINTRAMR